jgi:hypothetical protein
MMSGWLSLKQNELDKGTPRNINGVEVVVFLSPYDIPEGVRGDFDESLNRFVIRFKYVGGPEEPNEPVERESHDDHVTLVVGRHSHRLYRVEIDVMRLGANGIVLKVAQDLNEAIDWLSEKRQRPSNRGRYDVAKMAISERRDDLFRELAAK